ncbi:hypothetical protein Tco_0974322 [Tanacetum coccineum]|uniref:Uncharacterized protein n=1 Tax=Tanacetum coccineum TaxID=301880 RepID=A0ABQ5EB87_9ASTR
MMKSRGKGSQAKKTADTPVADVDVSEEFDSEPARKRTASRRVVKKKVTISAADNIIPDPDVALELGKSINLTKATEEEVERQVQATHTRIVTKSVPKPARRRPSCIAFRDSSRVSKKVSPDPSQKLKGVQSLTPEEQEAADTMQALKESKKTSRRQPGTGGSSEGIGVSPGVLDESTIVHATLDEGTKNEYSKEDKHDDEEVDWIYSDEDEEKKDDDKIINLEMTDDEETKDEFVQGDEQVNDDEDEEMTNAQGEESGNGDEENTDATKTDGEKTKEDTTNAKINSLLDINIQSEVTHIQPPSVLNVPVWVISETSVLTPIPKNPSVALVTTLPPPYVSTIPPVPHQKTEPIPTPPITIDAPTITTAVPESDALTDVQLRVAKLEKDVSKLNKMDHFAVALASLKSQVPMVVDKYLGSKVSDSLQKSPSEILKIKKEQIKKQKMPNYTIKYTDKAALKEYDQESALFQTMHKNKSFNRNPANHVIYHALMETLIEDEKAIDKEVTNTVKNHKRQHDDDENDDEDPSARPNQGKKIKRRRTKELESSKKPSTTKETLKGKAPSKSSKTGKSATAKEPVKEPIAEVEMDDVINTATEYVVHDANQPHDDSTQAKDKVSKKDWFIKPPSPLTPDLEWKKRQVILDQPEHPWFNQMVSAVKDSLTFDELMATPINFSKYVLNRLKIDHLTQEILIGPVYNLLKGTCTSSIELEYNMDECFKALIDRLDWNNPEGDRCPFDMTKPLPLKGHPGHLIVPAEYFFNNDLQFLKSFDLEKKYTTSITKAKAARYKIVGIEDMVPTLWSATKVGVVSVKVEKLHGYGHLDEIVVKRADRQLYKFKEGDFVDLHLNNIKDMLLLAVQHKLFHLNGSDIFDFIVALRMFTRSLIIKRRVEDLQLGVESYQKKLNITKPQKTFPEIEFKELHTPSYKPPGVIYEDLNKQKRVMWADELYKFSDGTLKTVCDELHHRMLSLVDDLKKLKITYKSS